MFVEEIAFNAAKLLAVVDLDAHIVIKGTDWCALIKENLFGVVKLSQPSETAGLLDATQYADLVK